MTARIETLSRIPYLAPLIPFASPPCASSLLRLVNFLIAAPQVYLYNIPSIHATNPGVPPAIDQLDLNRSINAGDPIAPANIFGMLQAINEQLGQINFQLAELCLEHACTAAEARNIRIITRNCIQDVELAPLLKTVSTPYYNHILLLRGHVDARAWSCTSQCCSCTTRCLYPTCSSSTGPQHWRQTSKLQ